MPIPGRDVYSVSGKYVQFIRTEIRLKVRNTGKHWKNMKSYGKVVRDDDSRKTVNPEDAPGISTE